MIERIDVKANGIRLACQVSGPHDAPPMVLLHALGEQAQSWDCVRDRFDDKYRVYALDLRGHGDSDWPGTYTYELMRDDVLGALDALALDRVTLIGHSLGGVVAYLIAQEHPHRVERLVVEDVPPPFPRNRPIPERPDEPVPFDWAMLTAMLGNPGDPVWWERLRDITAPTLVVAGGESSHIPQEKLEDVAARIPDCTLVTIDAGHHVHVPCPDEFADEVLRFLDSREVQAASTQ